MAIEFNFENDFDLNPQEKYAIWLEKAIANKEFELSELNYIFFDDHQLLELNQNYLNHDTYTDIITFDNAEEESTIESDIFISIDRVKENAASFDASFEQELRRVMAHGVLHLLGFGDKTEAEKQIMREQEEMWVSEFWIKDYDRSITKSITSQSNYR